MQNNTNNFEGVLRCDYHCTLWSNLSVTGRLLLPSMAEGYPSNGFFALKNLLLVVWIHFACLAFSSLTDCAFFFAFLIFHLLNY